MRIKIAMRHALIITGLAIPAILTAVNIPADPSSIALTFYPTVIAAFLIAYGLYLHKVKRPLSGIMQAITDKNIPQLQHYASRENSLGYLSRLLIQICEKPRLDTEIREKLKAEVTTNEIEKQYRLLFENSLDAVIITTPSGIITNCNQQARCLFKVKSTSVLQGEPINRFFDDAGKSVLHSLFSTMTDAVAACDFECKMTDTADSSFDAVVRYSVDSNDAKPLIHFCIRDMTALHQVTHEKATFEKHLQHLLKMEAIGQLANKIAHEFNNIFGAVSGYADLIKHHYTEDSRLQRYSQMIHSGTRRAALITDKLLTFAHIQKTVRENFNTFEELNALSDMIACTLPKSISLSVKTEGDSGTINGDREEFKSAIMNLAVNASNAMPDGGSLTITAAPFTASQDTARKYPAAVSGRHYIAVSCSDTGTGMDETTVAQLFEPFKLKNPDARGYGLGLITVYGTLMNHDGFITVHSTPGSGSTVALHFPQAEPQGTQHVQHTTKDNDSITILAADDENDMRETLNDILEHLGYQFTLCVNGQDAIEAFGKKPDMYDLVLLDMNMPGMTGLDCYHKLKTVRPEVKTLIMTGYYLDEESQGIIDEGIRGMILKPFIIEELDAALKEALLD